MPEIGEIRKAREASKNGRDKYIWHACVDCGKARWGLLVRGQPLNKRCSFCANKLKFHPCGISSSHWKGGRQKTRRGYILIQLQPDDFFYPMADKHGRVSEHRLVVAKALGRNLHSWEIVHHKEGYAKHDNRYPLTLQLVTDDRHKQITLLENRIRHLEQRVTLLEAENALLEAGTDVPYLRN